MKMLIITSLLMISAFAYGNEGAYTQKYKPEPAQTERIVRPALPKLTSPAALAKINTTETQLKWAPVDGAEGYHVQISVDPGFFNLHKEEFLTATETSVTGLEKGKIYFWRVAATKGSNQQGYTRGSFTRSSFEVQ